VSDEETRREAAAARGAAVRPPDAEDGERVTRAQALRRAGYAATGLIGGGWLVAAGRYLGAGDAPVTRFDLVAAGEVDLAELPKAFPQARVYLCADADGLFVLDAVCTHLGCTTEAASGGFRCPCHGSRYDATGEVIMGPAPRDLAHLHLALRDGRLWVDRERPVAAPSRLALPLQVRRDGGTDPAS
jgi:cytochrome b6-f complex iron-sulfur subunit